MSIPDLHPAIKEAIRHRSLIFFIGSGYSRNISLPDWIGLARKFVDQLAEKDDSLASLKDEAWQEKASPAKILDTLFKKGYKDQCRELLRREIDVDTSKYDLTNQQKIWNISKKVITTNFDKALESALDEDAKEELFIFTPSDKAGRISFLAEAEYLFKIHGTIDRPGTCILFSEDYDQLYEYNHKFLEDLKRMCTNTTLIFVGYSVTDIEIQRILKNIRTIFHTGTRHFTLTSGKKGYKKFGTQALRLESYDELIPYLDRLKAYRDEIDSKLAEITERVNDKYEGSRDLLSLFGRKEDIESAKDLFLASEDRKDILELEKLDGTGEAESARIIDQLKTNDKEEQLKDPLIVKREAGMRRNYAYFEHLETGHNTTQTQLSLAAYLRALKLAIPLFGDSAPEVINLYDEIGRAYLHLDSIVVFWPRSSVLHLARTGCCLANR